MMGSVFWMMGMVIWACIFRASFVSGISESALTKDGVVEGTVFVDSEDVIGKIDDDFVCATLDWWPPEKCDYGRCAWDHASFLNLDLSNKILSNAIKAFSPLKIRLGGSLQDKVIYEIPGDNETCPSFKKSSEMFGFTEGCLPSDRWDKLNAFFKETGAKIIFGLNALNGRRIQPDGTSTGAWDYKNAESFIRYTVQNNYAIYGWELGNELCGSGVGTRVAADRYASDSISLHNVVLEIYKDIEPKPLIVGPGGFFDAAWFKEYLDKTSKSLAVLTHHIYNLGPGVDERLTEKILDPNYLDGEANTFKNLQNTLKGSSSAAVSWVGEAGGAYNSGRNLVTNAFVFSFWYLDQLGMASAHDTKTYCRQTLIGGNYGLLNTATFVPNPDYYSALIWHHLMGRNVLSTSFSGTKKIRAYAHCAKPSKGITLLLINLDGNTSVQAAVVFNSTRARHYIHHKHKLHHLKSTQLLSDLKDEMEREEYHLTAKDGDLHSQTMLLNGKPLIVSSSGDIPSLEPLHVSSTNPITVAPFSIVFVHMPNIVLPACS